MTYFKTLWHIIVAAIAGTLGLTFLFLISLLFAGVVAGCLFLYAMGHGIVAIYKALAVEYEIYKKGINNDSGRH